MSLSMKKVYFDYNRPAHAVNLPGRFKRLPLPPYSPGIIASINWDET